jgi:DNA-binding NarL/FixJ family response regulator
VRVLIGEDSALFREGLAALLRSLGLEVVGAEGSPDAVLEAAGRTRPDIVVLDVRMPPTYTDEGIRVAEALRAARPDQPVLVLSQHIEARRSLRLVARGGFGYLLKDRVLDVEEFQDALERVAAGGSALDPEVVARALAAADAASSLRALTTRESEVLGLMAEGRTNKAIAQTLHLTERTVESHAASIFLKLELPSTSSHHRRVLAVIAYLQARAPVGGGPADRV